jgi:KDO2-lipid IV(A) lauroyltransferase
VHFFGHLAATNSATARLVKMTGAVVLPFYTVRRGDGKGFNLIVEPPFEGYPTGDLEADTQRINDIIEGWVRKYPEQYYWVHRRFRTRPGRSDPSLYD